jgi:adenylate cyclase
MEIMGDGILAIFNDRVEGGPTTAYRNAFEAAMEGIGALAQSNEIESDRFQLVAGFALHHGAVAYGNIGFGDRLDFTVIGREVNVTSRIEKLCRKLDRQLIMSGEFVNLLQQPMYEIGHFAMRGILDNQPLFGLPAET